MIKRVCMAYMCIYWYVACLYIHMCVWQHLLEGPMEVLLCECVNDLYHSPFHLLNCLITTACELRE